jgi:hypothetical protein
LEVTVREWKLVYKLLTQAEAVAIRSVLRSKMRSGRYLIVPHPLETKTFLEEAIYATMVGGYRILPQPVASARSFSLEMTFRELIGD